MAVDTRTDSPPPIGPKAEFAAVLITGVIAGEAGSVHPDGVFGAGEHRDEQPSVVSALGHGKKMARSIHAWLSSMPSVTTTKSSPSRFEHLNTWYFEDAPAAPAAGPDAMLDGTRALYEARRCLSCGGCFECDNCFSVCPDNAVVKLGPGLRYEFDLDYCKGCGICVTECPTGAIGMEPETL